MLKCYIVISYKKSIFFPKTGNPTTQPFNAKSFIRNIFRLNPAFAIFCAERIISQDPNSAEAKYLAKRYQKNCGKDIPMPVQPSVKVCTHIKVTGVRCGSPALRGEQFCYFHQRMMRGVPTPPNARVLPHRPASRARSPSRPPSWKSSTPWPATPSTSAAPN